MYFTRGNPGIALLRQDGPQAPWHGELCLVRGVDY